ncbi:hypothetical protein DRW03_25990 [Corallococcus sp. H22C18031201]|nr:hypothetical protein DRW03_25990 [Corallococcus sp. H22C18031201]
MSLPTQPPQKKKTLLGVGAAGLLAAAGFAAWSLLHPAPPPPAPEVATAQAPAPATPSPAPRTSPRRAPEQQPSAVVITEPRHAGDSADKGRPRMFVDDLRDKMMERHPDLAEFRTLQRKVLQTPAERERLHAVYRDREQLDAAKKDLLAESETTFNDDNQFLRLYRTEYLGMALEWAENPERAHVLDTVESLVTAQNLNATQDQALRRSLSGDKVELMMILLHNDRPRAEQLIAQAQAQGSEYANLLVYARTRFDALWALARQQQQQPQPNP